MLQLTLHRIPRRVLFLYLALAIAPSRPLKAAELKAETAKAWTAYVQATEQRIAEELKSQSKFLAVDFQPSTLADAERRALSDGAVPVVKMTSVDPSGKPIGVPEGMIHHWRGSIFIPGIGIERVLARVTDPTLEDAKQEDVLKSSVLEKGPDSLKLYLKLQRSKLVTVVYDTEHMVRYSRHGNTRASSRSVALRIAELENPNSASEREKPVGQDRGFLWRLNSYWRYEQLDGGVIVECESISLSRTVPALLEYLIRPLIDGVARESMQRTLESMRDRLRNKGRHPVPAGIG